MILIRNRVNSDGVIPGKTRKSYNVERLIIMWRKTFVVMTGLSFCLGMYGCKVRATADQVTSGAHGPSSPAASGEHGADAFNRAPFMESANKADAEHQTAGLTPEFTNGKVDPTMEGSGNLAWQGSYERAMRDNVQAQPTSQMSQPQPGMQRRPAAQAPTTPAPRSNYTQKDQTQRQD